MKRPSIPARSIREILLFSAILPLSSWPPAAARGEDDTQTISVSYQFESPKLEPVGDLTRLSLAGCNQLHRVGEPAMPFKTARILIPSGWKIEKAEAVPTAKPVELDGKWRVEYAGQSHFRPSPRKGVLKAGINRIIYESDALYPSSPVEVLSIQRLSGYEIAILRVFPLQYRPASGQLILSPQLNVRLRLARASRNSDPKNSELPIRPPDPSAGAKRVSEFVDNPELLRSLRAPEAKDDSKLIVGSDYLLITSNELLMAFQPLIDRKIQDGLGVKVATVEEILKEQPGVDGPEKIRNYIRFAYTSWGIRYVLLGGGTRTIPCRYAFVPGSFAPRDSYLPCDLYYSCLDGSWNGNGDKHWGDPMDGASGGDVDLLGEVFVGRAPVSSVEQVKNFVEKSIRYESEGNPNKRQLLLTSIFLGEFSTGPCQGSDMYRPILPMFDGWQVSSLDDSPSQMPQWATEEALAALDRSPHVVLYNGHGDADFLMRMRTPDLKRLTNEWPFLLCSVGCSAAEFDHGKFLPDSFGEVLVNGGAHGAFAAILNARVGWFDPQYPWKYSGEFQVKLFEQLLKKGHPLLGEAHQMSKEDLVGQVESSGMMTYRWCYYGITLLGDPHLALKVSAPEKKA